MFVQIQHRESTVTQNVLVRHRDGRERRLTFAYEIGTETINSLDGTRVRSIARWENSELVLESRSVAAGPEICFRDYWSLSGDAQTLTMEHRDDSLAGQTAVFTRARDDAARF
jgi:hypothetical protein